MINLGVIATRRQQEAQALGLAFAGMTDVVAIGKIRGHTDGLRSPYVCLGVCDKAW